MNDYGKIKIIDKNTVYIDSECIIEEGVTIHPNNTLIGRCKIGKNTTLMPNNTINNSVIGENCNIFSSVILSSNIKNNATIGPFSYIRPDCEVGENCKVGSFTELKAAKIGDKSKIPHLSYVGDADVGKNTNIGCGVIFANYDGKNKHKTRVGSDCFIGCNVNLISPANIGDNCFVAAGTTVGGTVPPKSFIIGRVRAKSNIKLAKKYITPKSSGEKNI